MGELDNSYLFYVNKYESSKNTTSINEIKNIMDINKYSGIVILFKDVPEYIQDLKIREEKTKYHKFGYRMENKFKNEVIEYVNNNPDDSVYTFLSPHITSFITNEFFAEYQTNGIDVPTLYDIRLVNPESSGGKKAVVKHTVKQLQAIASKNNIKITKKVEGKTVRLNKQGLIAKLKRYKLI